MPLVFDAKSFISDGRIAVDSLPPSANRDCSEVSNFINAVFKSNGLNCTDPDQYAQDWVSADRKVSFLVMAEALVNDLLPLPELDLVIVAHWSTDNELGHSISNAIIHQCQAKDAFGFAISDSGPVAPFIACELIDKWMEEGSRQALLVTMDQSTHLHPTSLLSDDARDNQAAAFVLSHQTNGQPLFHHKFSLDQLPNRDSFIDSLESSFRLHLEDIYIVCDEQSLKYMASGLESEVFLDSASSSTPFYLANKHLEAGKHVLVCRQYRNELHVLYLGKEETNENC
ncbi:hypothetical protein AB6C54_18505 [Vibrio splendidus]